VSFRVLTATSMKVAVFWDVVPCSLVDYTAQNPRRQPTVYVTDIILTGRVRHVSLHCHKPMGSPGGVVVGERG
jgi:hypothetical protein